MLFRSGAVIDAAAMEKPLADDRILGLGEFMDYPGVISAADGILDKLMAAKAAGKLIDGHSPSVKGLELNAYAAALIHTDHECSTVEELRDRIAPGGALRPRTIVPTIRSINFSSLYLLTIC